MKITYIILTSVVVLLCSSCGRVDQRHAVDDRVLHIHLSRSFVQAHGVYDRDETLVQSLDMNIDGDMIESLADFVGDCGDSEAAVVVVTGVVVGTVVIGIATVGEAYQRLERTTIEIEPVEASNYRQRLYWGHNVFYYPRELGENGVPVRIVFTGAYTGTYEMLMRHNGNNRAFLR